MNLSLSSVHRGLRVTANFISIARRSATNRHESYTYLLVNCVSQNSSYISLVPPQCSVHWVFRPDQGRNSRVSISATWSRYQNHTSGGRQHTRDDPPRPLPYFRRCSRRFCLTCMRHKKVRNHHVRFLPQAESYSPKLKVSESQDEICFSTSTRMGSVSTYDVMEQVLTS